MKLKGILQHSSVVYQLGWLILMALGGAFLSILLIWIGGWIYTTDAQQAVFQTAQWMNNTSFLKLFQLISTLFTFGLPPILFYYLKDESTIIAAHHSTFSWVLVAWLGMWCFMPGITWLEDLNKSITFPSSLKAMQDWFQSMEANALAATEMLLSSNTSWSGYISNMVLISFTAGFAEELFFRGTLQRVLQKKMNYHLAIWIAAFVFSAIHFQFYGFIPRMILGAWLGYLFFFSGNLWIPILAHAINNGTAVTADALSRNGYFSDKIQWLEEYSSPFIGLFSLFAVVCITVWVKRRSINLISMKNKVGS